LTEARLALARKDFEFHVKRIFNPYEPDPDNNEFEVRLRGTRDRPEIGLVANYLKLTRLNIL